MLCIFQVLYLYIENLGFTQKLNANVKLIAELNVFCLLSFNGSGKTFSSNQRIRNLF